MSNFYLQYYYGIFRFIFGGFNAREAKHYNDMWCYDPKSQKWSEVHGFGKKPSARRRHTAVCIGSQVKTCILLCLKILSAPKIWKLWKWFFKVFISGGTSPITDDLSSQYDLVQKDETEQLQDHDQTIVVELEPTLNTIWNGFIFFHSKNVIWGTIKNNCKRDIHKLEN